MEIKKMISSELGKNSLFNIASIFLSSILALLVFFIIAIKYGPSTLGIFNLIYSFYIILSQIGTLGVPTSVLVHLGMNSHDKRKCDELITSSFAIVAILGVLISYFIFLSRNFLADVFKNPEISWAIYYSIIGLWCFIMNKLLLNIVNGLNKMKDFAILNVFRYIFMFSVLLVAVFMDLPRIKMPIIISVSEGIFTIVLFLYVLKLFHFVGIKKCIFWLKIHSFFGIKGFGGFLVPGINTRINVFMLSYFCSTTLVGIYSFAAVIVDGINQFPAVLRTNITPVFAEMIAKKEKNKIEDIISKGKKILFPLMILVSIAGIIVYPFIVQVIIKKPDFMSGWPVFIILILGSIFYGTYFPFREIILQAGYPGWQTFYIFLLVATNVVLNFILIPKYNIIGAAVATSLSYILSVVYIKFLSWRLLKIKI
jgi:O-antigen/teichoic acid export membrane protein